MAEEPLERKTDTPQVVRGVVAGAIGLIATGLLANYLTHAGPSGSPELAWIVGYGLTVFIGWHYLIRPINFGERHAQ
ncbi:hypothetical protein [Halocatena halophila]|uniref:hypothetical protein n=1 Tax=Halocatena halophila TaxID=2814576 RepID=UPI002ED0D2FF